MVWKCYLEYKTIWSYAHMLVIIGYLIISWKSNKKWLSGLNVTYSSRPWVGDAPLECNPLKVGPFSMSEGPVEDCENVRHVVHAHCWAFKHGAETTCTTWVRHCNRNQYSPSQDPPRWNILRLFIKVSFSELSLGELAVTLRWQQLTYFLLDGLMWFGSAI